MKREVNVLEVLGVLLAVSIAAGGLGYLAYLYLSVIFLGGSPCLNSCQ